MPVIEQKSLTLILSKVHQYIFFMKCALEFSWKFSSPLDYEGMCLHAFLNVAKPNSKKMETI